MALILSRADVERCLTISEAISVMRSAFVALHQGQAEMPQRLSVSLSEEGVALMMPSLLQTIDQSVFSLKVITVMPRNPSRKLPLSYATVLLLDATTGRTLALLDGTWLTAMRTGAVSGLATDILALRDANSLALFGAGGQAPTQVLAIHSVRPLQEIRVVNRDEEHYRALVATLHTLLGAASPPIQRAHSASEALAGASLVACATTATEPLFQWSDIAPGTHINAIGAFTPTMREVDAETVRHARVIVDQRAAALEEAGDLLQAVKMGRGPETWSELGELLAGARPGRQSDTEVTLFKSVGVGVQDIAVALHVYRRARELNIGIEVEL